MKPSPDAIAAIRQRVIDWAPSDQAIADILNTQMVPNPAAQGNVAPSFDLEGLMGCLSTAEIVHVKEFTTTERMLADVDVQNHLNVARWASVSMLSSDLSPASGQKVIALVTTPVPDPTWRAQLPWPVVDLGRLVDADDVAAARGTP